MKFVLKYFATKPPKSEWEEGVVYVVGSKDNPDNAFFIYEHDDCSGDEKCYYHRVPMSLEGGATGWRILQENPLTFDTSITSGSCNLHISIINGEVVKH